MKKNLFRLFMLTALVALLASCATTSHYVDETDIKGAVKNNNAMSASDWRIIAQDAAQAMLTSPIFAEFLMDYEADANEKINQQIAAGKTISARERRNSCRPLLMLSTIENNTGEHIDSRLMTERVREVLFNSGKVRFTTYAAGEGQSVDVATAAARVMAANDPNINQATAAKTGTVNAYDLQLSGVIIKQRAKSGRANEISFTFTLSLTDTKTGEGVWTYTKEIVRQNTKGIFGK